MKLLRQVVHLKTNRHPWARRDSNPLSSVLASLSFGRNRHIATNVSQGLLRIGSQGDVSQSDKDGCWWWHLMEHFTQLMKMRGITWSRSIKIKNRLLAILGHFQQYRLILYLLKMCAFFWYCINLYYGHLLTTTYSKP